METLANIVGTMIFGAWLALTTTFFGFAAFAFGSALCEVLFGFGGWV